MQSLVCNQMPRPVGHLQPNNRYRNNRYTKQQQRVSFVRCEPEEKYTGPKKLTEETGQKEGGGFRNPFAGYTLMDFARGFMKSLPKKDEFMADMSEYVDVKGAPKPESDRVKRYKEYSQQAYKGPSEGGSGGSAGDGEEFDYDTFKDLLDIQQNVAIGIVVGFIFVCWGVYLIVQYQEQSGLMVEGIVQ